MDWESKKSATREVVQVMSCTMATAKADKAIYGKSSNSKDNKESHGNTSAQHAMALAK
jgi:hypothetical protein